MKYVMTLLLLTAAFPTYANTESIRLKYVEDKVDNKKTQVYFCRRGVCKPLGAPREEAIWVDNSMQLRSSLQKYSYLYK